MLQVFGTDDDDDNDNNSIDNIDDILNNLYLIKNTINSLLLSYMQNPSISIVNEIEIHMNSISKSHAKIICAFQSASNFYPDLISRFNYTINSKLRNQSYNLSDVRLLRLYLLICIGHGWILDIQSARIIVNLFPSIDLFLGSDTLNKLNLWDRVLKIADLMSIQFSNKKAVLLKFLNVKGISLPDLYLFLFGLILNAKPIARIQRNFHHVNYTPKFCEIIGELYFASLQLDNQDRKIWDINYYDCIFFDLIQFSRDSDDEVRFIFEAYKNADFRTKKAIAKELRMNQPISNILNRLQTFDILQQISTDTLLIYSEIYFTQGQSTIWTNSCNGIGYFIIRYSERWVTLCNTINGYMTSQTGSLFDAQLLDSTPDNLYFKLLKRDGWHSFTISTGLEEKCWDSIELISPANLNQKYPSYFLKQVDKVFYLFDSVNSENLGEFKEASAVKFLSHHPITVAVYSKQFWRLFNCSQRAYIDSLPIKIKSVDLVPQALSIIVLNEGESTGCCLYDLQNNKFLKIDEIIIKKCHFASFSTVYAELMDESFVHIDKCETYQPVSSSMFNELSRYHLYPQQKFSSLQQIGLDLFNQGQSVRYQFVIELQGSYHIIKEQSSSILSLHNTVGGGRYSILYIDAHNIDFLGVYDTFFNNRIVFFLIEANNNKKYLYVSYYSQLKLLLDQYKTIESNSIPYKLVDMSSYINVDFIQDNFLRLYHAGGWNIYEYPYGFHSIIQAEDIAILDFKNFLKVKKNTKWYLYDLSKRCIVNSLGANSIELSVENNILLIYSDHIRYISYNSLPLCTHREIVLNCINVTSRRFKGTRFDNYMVNIIRLGEYKGISNTSYMQPYAQILLSFSNHQLLKRLNLSFVRKLAELFDGKSISLVVIEQSLAELKKVLTQLPFCNKVESTELIDTIKPIIRKLNKQYTLVSIQLESSFGLNLEWIQQLQQVKIQFDSIFFVSAQNIDLEGDLKKLSVSMNQTFDNLKQIQRKKEIEMNNLLEMLDKHPHILSNILLNWFTIDNEGDRIDELYQRLSALINLYLRSKNRKDNNGYELIQNFYLIFLKLYAFDSKSIIINNYIMSEIQDSAYIQELFALLDSLKGNAQEISLFSKFIKFAPGLNSKQLYEELQISEQSNEHSRLKSIIHILRLFSIANELKNEDLYNLGINDTAKRKEDIFNNFIKSAAVHIKHDFYYKLGINNDQKQDMIDEQYLVDIMYANDNLNGDNKDMLIIMLKAVIYDFDLKLLLTLYPIEFKPKFSNKENYLLTKLQQHNSQFQFAFESTCKLNWNIWQNGIKSLESEHILVSLWNRNIAHDLFQGEFCNSCISLSKSNARANLQYLYDFNFAMVEIKYKNNKLHNNNSISHQTIGHVTIWVANDVKQSGFILVLNSIQFHRKYIKYEHEIRDRIFIYCLNLSAQLGTNRVILAQNYNSVSVRILEKIDDLYIKQTNYKERVDQEIVLNMIYPTYSDDMYSDIYDDGWIQSKNITNLKTSIWDISLFINKAKFIFNKDLPNKIQELTENFQIWLVASSKFKQSLIKIITTPVKLILIDESCWKENHDTVITKIEKKLNSREFQLDELKKNNEMESNTFDLTDDNSVTDFTSDKINIDSNSKQDKTEADNFLNMDKDGMKINTKSLFSTNFNSIIDNNNNNNNAINTSDLHELKVYNPVDTVLPNKTKTSL